MALPADILPLIRGLPDKSGQKHPVQMLPQGSEASMLLTAFLQQRLHAGVTAIRRPDQGQSSADLVTNHSSDRRTTYRTQSALIGEK
jgi:hypothetical protein